MEWVSGPSGVSVIRREATVANAGRRNPMSVPTGSPQDTQVAIAALVFVVACLCVAYWRTALRLVLVIFVALIMYGAIVGVTALIALHHR